MYSARAVTLSIWTLSLFMLLTYLLTYLLLLIGKPTATTYSLLLLLLFLALPKLYSGLGFKFELNSQF